MRLFDKIKNRPLRSEILTIFSALLCITAVFEIWYSSHASRKLILNFDNEYYAQKSSSIAANWLNSYFKQIEVLVGILAQNAITLDKFGNRFSDFEDLFKEGLKKTPFALSFYVGFRDGTYMHIAPSRYVLAQPNDEITNNIPSYAVYLLKKIEKGIDEKLIEHWEYLNEDCAPVFKRNMKTISMDPRKRPWYRQAEINNGVTWTDAYLFQSTKTAGVTVTRSILQRDHKEPIGAVAIDFCIPDFKKLLADHVKPTENSDVRLINTKNEIIASTAKDDEAKIEGDKEIVLISATDTKDEILAGAVKELLGTKAVQTTYQTKDGTEYVATLKKLDKVPFSLIITTPQSDFIGNVKKIKLNMILMSILTYIIFSGVILWFSKRISKPIVQLYKSAKEIGNMELENFSASVTSNILEISKLSEAMNVIKSGISTFSKYAPKDLVRKLLKNGTKPELGGKAQDITMFFSHIEDFPSISERLPAEYLVLHLSEYFDELTKNIVHNKGTIDKYIGDAIMAIWGAPNDDEDQVIHACEAALNCQRILAQLNKKWAPLGKPSLSTKIGIHTGTAIVGNIGSRERMNFTAIGDSVNIASRLGGANKFYGTSIMVSETVEAKARNKVLFRTIDKIAVKGRNAGIVVFEPLGLIQNADETYYKMMELCSKSKEAFELFQAQHFKDALKLYSEIQTIFPEKSESISPLIERCKDFIARAPKDWDGVNHLKSK